MSNCLTRLAARSQEAVGKIMMRPPTKLFRQEKSGWRRSRATRQRFYSSLSAALLTTTSIASQGGYAMPANAQTRGYCQFSQEAIAEKDSLLKVSLKGNADAQKRYKALIKQHAENLRQCRNQTWPSNQAIWLRLYPCDARPGVLDALLDRIVNRGYNQVYVETFGNGQVLIPKAENVTAWPSVLRSPGSERTDLLAQIIQKGRERGLRVYSWLFTMNFGYSYATRPDRQSVLARNARGETSLAYTPDEPQAFIDPYNQQAKIDYYRLVQLVMRRRPDGVLFDYVRYPRGSGNYSVVSKVQDLWIYGTAARQALTNRALNSKGRDLIQRFVGRGYISAGDVEEVDRLYPQEGSPLWQGRNPPVAETLIPAFQRQPLLQWELWQLSVAHSVQGVLDFLSLAMLPVQKQGVKGGAVFFPEGNQAIGQIGYDSRLQPWDRFPASMEWHPMLYAVCGNSRCIEEQAKRVVKRAPSGTVVAPVLAGVWGQFLNGNRPPLEAQMQGIRQVAPQINTVSHFAYSWQDPIFDGQRKSCR